jgi:hypothetical protein
MGFFRRQPHTTIFPPQAGDKFSSAPGYAGKLNPEDIADIFERNTQSFFTQIIRSKKRKQVFAAVGFSLVSFASGLGILSYSQSIPANAPLSDNTITSSTNETSLAAYGRLSDGKIEARIISSARQNTVEIPSIITQVNYIRTQEQTVANIQSASEPPAASTPTLSELLEQKRKAAITEAQKMNIATGVQIDMQAQAPKKTFNPVMLGSIKHVAFKLMIPATISHPTSPARSYSALPNGINWLSAFSGKTL